VAQLVEGCGSPIFGAAERAVGGKLNEVGTGCVESLVAACTNTGVAVVEDDLGGFGSAPRGILNLRCLIRRRTLDLAGMKYCKVF